MPFAVLIPVYHGEDPRLFASALDSIESQEVTDDEVRIYLGVDGPLGNPLEQIVSDHEPRFSPQSVQAILDPHLRSMFGNFLRNLRLLAHS